jgi:FkbM family methyltransferase
VTGLPEDCLPALAACLSEKRAGGGTPVFALQIGAMDGVQFDPLHRLIRLHGWHALLVEPLPDSFAALKSHYADLPGIAFANCAIGEVPGSMPLYYVPRDVVQAEGFPAWVLGISSLTKAHIESQEGFFQRSGFSGLMRFVRTVSVEVVTLKMLLEAYGSPHVDVLQIDAEGFDYKVMRQWDFSASAPAIVNFEHARLTADEKALSVELLLAHGYVLYRRGLDVTGFCSEMLRF